MTSNPSASLVFWVKIILPSGTSSTINLKNWNEPSQRCLSPTQQYNTLLGSGTLRKKSEKSRKNHPRRTPDTSFGYEVVSHRCTRSARHLKYCEPWHAQIWAVAVSDKGSFTGATEVKRLSVRALTSVLKVNSDEVDKGGASTPGLKQPGRPCGALNVVRSLGCRVMHITWWAWWEGCQALRRNSYVPSFIKAPCRAYLEAPNRHQPDRSTER